MASGWSGWSSRWASFAGNRLAWWAGDVIAVLDAIAQLGFVPAYPSWSLSVLAIDVLVIYGLSAHGGRALWGLTGARSQWPG